jgi:7-cyano-7-deazaguanine synthase
MPNADNALAVLTSGGLDSAILLGDSLRCHAAVYPLYLRKGLSWEAEELRHLQRYLEALCSPSLRPLQILDLPVTDLYGSHWSITGRDVPGAETPDEAVFLPGRNVLFLAKAMLWCHLHDVPAVALGVLGSNPFPDATPAFFAEFSAVVNRATGSRVEVFRPFAGMHKTEVMHRGRELPLHLTFSCIRPMRGRHCGRCNKCAERLRAFAEAGLPDLTDYEKESSCTG